MEMLGIFSLLFGLLVFFIFYRIMVDISAIRKAIESDKPELLEKSQKNDKLRLIVYPLLLVIAFAVVYFLAP
jgi:predicted Holliday junction resolvase-like endonuclease